MADPSAAVGATSPTGPGAPPTPPRPTDLGTLKPLVETVGLVAAQLSVLGSVLVYFGSIATRVEARFFGLDPNQLDYSNQDLLMRAIAPMLGPLTIGGAVGVFLLQLNNLVARRAERLEHWPRIGLAVEATTLAGLGFLAAGAVWQWHLGSRHSYWSPLFLGLGAVLVLCGRGTAAMLNHRRQHRPPPASLTNPQTAKPMSPIRALDAHSKLVLGFVVVFAVFGFTARLAQADGFRRAISLVADLDERTTVSVLSEEPLILNRRGVACFPVSDSRFTRRYTGLHLLAYRNDRFFLVPTGFDVNNGVLVVLLDDPSIRVEYDATPQLRRAEGLPTRPPIESPDPTLRC